MRGAPLPPLTGPQTPLRVAFTITVTSDPPANRTMLYNGAAVLAHSIARTVTAHNAALLALVHPGISRSRPVLAALGYRITEFPLPVPLEDIEDEWMRGRIDKSGCCGSSELLKLSAYQLVDFDYVLLLDVDTMLRRNLDGLIWRASAARRAALFTMDYAMGSSLVQGGFILLKPSRVTYDRLVDLVKKGRYRPRTGWAKSGFGGGYGGITVQGLLAYYYKALAPPGASEALDPCEYNAMHDRVHRPAISISYNCSHVRADDIFSVHFTTCPKPWACKRAVLSGKPKCRQWTYEWWEMRNDLATRHGAAAADTAEPCCRRCKKTGTADGTGRVRFYSRPFPQLPIPLPDGGKISL